MRVALLDPAEGAELAGRLAGAGHEVTVIDGARWRVPARLLDRRGWEPDLGALPAALLELGRRDFDLVHAFSHVLGWGALRTRARPGDPPLVLGCPAPLTRDWLVAARSRLQMLERLAAEAEAITAPDEEAAAAFERYLLRRPTVMTEADVTQLDRLYRKLTAR